MAWQQGQSGNPAGRPKEASSEAKRLARQHTVKAVQVLAELLDADDLRARAVAAQALLDRGWGKPAQETILKNDDDGQPFVMQVISGVPRADG
jgi:hypothetical protein